MIFLANYGRTITAFLALFYLFTGSGLDKLTYQGVSLIKRSVVFPCKGKGCQCDRAGYELPNCQCRHDEGISCCSTEIVEVEEDCCSEFTDSSPDKSLHGSIENIPCQGVEDSFNNSLLKHTILVQHTPGTSKISHPAHFHPYTKFLKSTDKYPLDKVPIFS